MRDASLPIPRYAPPALRELEEIPRESLRSTAAVQAEVSQLFAAAAPSVRRYVRSCGVTPEAAEDIVQETFLALFRHLCGGGARHNLRGWLMQVGFRLALRHRARQARMQRRASQLASDGAQGIADAVDDPEAQLALCEHQSRLQAVFRALPERERQCLSLRAEGVRYREIAQTLGVSLGTVAKSLAYAITRLSNAVKG